VDKAKDIEKMVQPICRNTGNHRSEVWCINGKCHREDGPAIDNSSGNREYWVNGKRHRVDGPAMEYSYGKPKYYMRGKILYQETFLYSREYKEGMKAKAII
jgi:hypothetical protein